MGRPGARSEQSSGGGHFERVAGFVVKRPRKVIGVWLALVGVLTFLGLGLESKLTSKPIFIEGSESAREHELVVEEFGDDAAMFVLLRGPRDEIEAQGRVLERRLDALPRTLVIAPWDQDGGIEGLQPSDRELALLVSTGLPQGEGLAEIVAPVRDEIDAVVKDPVRASVAGAPAVVESFRDAAAEAAVSGERIAIPVLMIVLLLVFRSVIAAAIPVLIGGTVVASTRGVLDLLLNVVEIDTFALGAVGMMGLALGVDYSLLIVSRFREEIGKDEDVGRAVTTTVAATGRSVFPAGCGLVLAMVVASFVLAGGVVASVAIAVTVAAILSVASALIVVPAMLTVLGPGVDRWSRPRPGGDGMAARWSTRMSSHPRLVWPIMLFLVFAAAWAFTLKSGVATIALLPPDDPGRIQQEDVQEALGPGWVAPLEIVMDGRGGPVTTPERLRALARFQRQVEEDPDVASMAGLSGIERSTRGLNGFEQNLRAQERGLRRIDRGIVRVHKGSLANTEGLREAAGGASTLGAAIGETRDGAGLLTEGARNASQGSRQLSDGLGRASDGSDELAEGTAKSSEGADRLAGGLAKAAKDSSQAAGNAEVLENAMGTGKEDLGRLQAPVRGVEDQLRAAQQSLEGMTAGRTDPRYQAALTAVLAALRELTGTDPASGAQVDPSYAGVQAGIADAESQFDLGDYLAGRIRKNGEEAHEGMSKLARSSARLDRGLARLTKASERMSGAVARLQEGGDALSPAMQRLARGSASLTEGLGEVRDGAGGLASGLDQGASDSTQLSGALADMHSGIQRQQEDGDTSQLDESPDMFRSGYFYLASLDGSESERRGEAAFLVSIDQGGGAARMLVIPRIDPLTEEAHALSARIGVLADELAAETGTEVVIGGVAANRADIDTELREQAPLARLALCLVTLLVLLPVVRSLTLALLAALINLVTVSATFGLLALFFNGSLLGGPGYVDTTVLPATIMVIFGLAIDYEVFVFARMREEYERTGSNAAAISNGLGATAHVITGAAVIMIVVFLIFSISPFATLRQFGLAQAIAVFIDAFIVRLFVLPVLMRAMGDWSWWMPGWLDRLLPGGSRPIAAGGRSP